MNLNRKRSSLCPGALILTAMILMCVRGFAGGQVGQSPETRGAEARGREAPGREVPGR